MQLLQCAAIKVCHHTAWLVVAFVVAIMAIKAAIVMATIACSSHCSRGYSSHQPSWPSAAIVMPS